jgi:SAM-dependent methyltransferase
MSNEAREGRREAKISQKGRVYGCFSQKSFQFSQSNLIRAFRICYVMLPSRIVPMASHLSCFDCNLCMSVLDREHHIIHFDFTLPANSRKPHTNANEVHVEIVEATLKTHFELTTAADYRNQPCATGVRVYEGAIAASHFLLHCNTFTSESASFSLNGARVLELGCGCGLTGLVAAQFARAVTLTDGAPDACTLTTANAQRLSSEVKAACLLDVTESMWDADALTKLTTSVRRRDAACLDASQPLLCSNYLFDVIIGVELVYFRVDLPLLLNAVGFLLDCGRDESLFTDCTDVAAAPVAVMAHINRLPNGNQQLLAGAADAKLALAFVPIRHFMPPAAMDGRFANVEVVVVARDPRTLQARFGPLVPLLDRPDSCDVAPEEQLLSIGDVF